MLTLCLLKVFPMHYYNCEKRGIFVFAVFSKTAENENFLSHVITKLRKTKIFFVAFYCKTAESINFLYFVVT